MKFKIKVKNDKTSWEEEYVENFSSEDEIDICYGLNSKL